MTKQVFFVVLLLVVMFVLVPGVGAGTPDIQPWMYACAEQCGFGTVEATAAAFGNFQYAQAAKYNYAPADYARYYNRDVSEFLSKHGMAGAGINDAGLSIKLRIDVPVAICDFKGICMQ